MISPNTSYAECRALNQAVDPEVCPSRSGVPAFIVARRVMPHSPMNRRELVRTLLLAPVLGAVDLCPASAGSAKHLAITFATNAGPLTPCGPIWSVTDGQIIENLDITSTRGSGLTVVHRNVTVRNCRIRHAGGHGIFARGATGVRLEMLEIDHVGAPAAGAGPDAHRNNIHLEGCGAATIARVKASRGSSNIYILRSPRVRLNSVELHDARGPEPRGQNVQLDRSPYGLLQDFSAENTSASWTEDNISVFHSDNCAIRRGLVSYNNSPTGDGVMLEGSSYCLVEDVDAVQQGNGAFAAVPEGNARSAGCIFRRCRTRDSYNARRDGRPEPSSGGLSFYMLASPGDDKHTIADCHYENLANPNNLIWDLKCVKSDWSFTRQAFVPRRPVRL